MTNHGILTGVVIDETIEFDLDELCRVCGVSTEWLITLVEEGVLEPEGSDHRNWRFNGNCLRRVRIARELETDLGVNLPGAALALELLDEVERLRKHIALLKPQH